MAKSDKRGGVSQTARMFARKQQSIQRVRNSSLVERPRTENDRVSSHEPKPCTGAFCVPVVGEHRCRAEAAGRPAVERHRKKM